MTRATSPSNRLPAGTRPDRRPTAAAAAAAGAALLVTALLVGLAPPVRVPGVPVAPALISWGVLASRALLDLAVTATLGLGLVPLMFTRDEQQAASRVLARAYRNAVPVAALWCAGVLSCLVLQVAELDPASGVRQATVVTYVREIGGGQALLVTGVVGLAVLGVGVTGRRTGGLLPARLLLAGGAAGIVPLVTSGHAGGGSERFHDLATVALELHVFAAALWTGGLGATVWLLAGQRALLARALPRYSRVAAACLAAVAATGLVSGLVELGGGPDPILTELFGSGYGYLLLGKAGCLAVLAGLGARVRYRLLPVIERARPTGFAAWAGLELAVMGVAFGLAVALSRSPV